MRDLTSEIIRLSPERRRLLERLLGEEAAETHRPSRLIPRGTNSGPLPLSFAQQRFWFINQLEPESAAYNTPAAVRLRGRLKVEALERTLNEIIRRHEILRTTYEAVEGKAYQVIHDAQPFRLPVFDLSSLPETGREEEARRLAAAEALRPFDLTRGPVMRASLLRLDGADHVLLLTIHHIACDGWSTGILIREVAQLYEAFVKDQPSPLANLPVQYADYAIWERDFYREQALAEHVAYWKRQLGGDDFPALELPTDYLPTEIQTSRGALQSIVLPEALSAALKSFCQQQDVTLFMMLLAAYQTLLYRYTGEEDIRVGSPIAGRKRAELEGLVGCFINTLVLRTDISGNPGFLELLGRVREVCLEAFARQDVPFEKLVEELRAQRTQRRERLFNVWFVLQNAPLSRLALPGLTLSVFPVERETTQFDLAMFVFESGPEITVELNYSTDLFKTATIAEMLRRFATLLAAVLKHPGLPLMDLPLDPQRQDPDESFESPQARSDETEDAFML
jgi:aspartate racemase